MAHVIDIKAAAAAKAQRQANPLGFPTIVLPKAGRRATSRRARAQAVHFAAKSAL